MNTESKKEVKKNVVTGASTVAGATAGVAIGAILTPDEAVAQENTTTDPVQAPETGHHDTQIHIHTYHQPATTTDTGNTTNTGTQTGGETVTPVNPPHDEVEVLAYDRVTDEDGSQMDVAVINYNGNTMQVCDLNLDGEADLIVSDLNHNNVIEEGEYAVVQGQGIAMAPLAEAAGFDPHFAQNDLPDYVNNANIDNYMA